MMLIQHKMRKVASGRINQAQNAVKAEHGSKGIHMLKQMHADKAKQVNPQRGSSKPAHASRSKQLVQVKMQKLNPEEPAKLSKTPVKKIEVCDAPQISDLTCKTIIENGEAMFKEICSKEFGVNAGSSLKNHSISPLLRAKMVNWMIEVLNTFECEDQTFFTAVTIMDLFYANTSK